MNAIPARFWAFVAFVVMGVLLATAIVQSTHLDGKQIVDDDQVARVESGCDFFEDGSAVCEPGTWPTSTTVAR